MKKEGENGFKSFLLFTMCAWAMIKIMIYTN